MAPDGPELRPQLPHPQTEMSTGAHPSEANPPPSNSTEQLRVGMQGALAIRVSTREELAGPLGSFRRLILL